jgi:aspartate carbamoyltransferase catalytic subunit
MNFKGSDVISIRDFTREGIEQVLSTAGKLEAMPEAEKARLIPTKVVALLFFEPSTRTRLSFEAAVNRLGGRTIGVVDPGASSAKKGETLWDTIKTVERYSDLIVMRHPRDGAARHAADAASIPLINAGDGAGQHPTQALLDLYTMRKIRGRIDGMEIAMVGDLKYGRTVHSLLLALARFQGCVVHLVSPKSLRMPAFLLKDVEAADMEVRECRELEEIIPRVDILYMTRIQRERFPDPADYEKVKFAYTLNAGMLEGAREGLKVMHPLPRVTEIERDVDLTPHCHYFDQVEQGIPVRQALITLLLGLWPGDRA